MLNSNNLPLELRSSEGEMQNKEKANPMRHGYRNDALMQRLRAAVCSSALSFGDTD
jgi:hypothetical protein